jgi:hypothetical protein
MMNVIGTELVQEELKKMGYFFKVVMNDSCAVFFSGKIQHSTVKRDGLSYEDDYKGNALAAIITDRRMEIRNHNDFGVPHVHEIVKILLQHPGLELLRDFDITYRGNKLK